MRSVPFLGYYEVYSGNSVPAFRYKLSGSVFKDQEIKGDGKDGLSRNVGKKLPLYAAGYPRVAQMSRISKNHSWKFPRKFPVSLWLP
jgi:hypothetical protein